MAFLNPLLLLALAAVAVPILLHLLRRRETRYLVFPALRYLTRTTQEQARIIRLRQLLLLATRVAGVVLLVAAAARLVLPVGGGDHPPAGIAIVIDNGIGSGAVVGGVRLLDSLLVRAEEAIARTGERDRIWLVTAGEPWRPAVPMSPASAIEALGGVSYSAVRPNLPAAVSRASALLDAAAPEIREIVVISDLAEAAFPAPPPGTRGSGDPVSLAPPPSGAPPNRGVAEILVSGGLAPRAGEPAEIQVTVSGDDANETVVRAYVSDRLVASGRTGDNGRAILTLPPPQAGWAEGRVELDPDDLRVDDVVAFTFLVIPAPVVEVSGSISPYLLDALTVLANAGRIIVAQAPQPASVHVVGAGAPATPPSGAAVILIPPGDAALLPSINRAIDDLLPGWRLEASNEPPGERELAGGELLPSVQIRPRIRQALRIVPAGPPGSRAELLTLSDGEPWLVRANQGERTVMIVGSPMTEEASDLPTSAGLVPLLDLLISFVSGGEQEWSVRSGEPLRVPARTVAIQTPDGGHYSVEGSPWFARTGEAGIYRFLDTNDEVVHQTAVTPAPPSDGRELDLEEAVARLRPVWEGARAAEPWPDAVLEGRRGREVAGPIAALLLVVLVAETWLAASGAGARGGASGL